QGYSGFDGACQGGALAVSGDGNTIITAGSEDNGAAGAAWVFARANGTWNQQGPRLGVSDASVSRISLGSSVAISGDGNTAVVGGPADFNFDGVHSGATWAFTRTFGVWNQQGGKLVAA